MPLRSALPAVSLPEFVALVAIFRHGERAISVFAAVVPLLFVVFFVLAELIIGHD